MAEWLALLTSQRDNPSSIPAKGKTFFGVIKSFAITIHCLSFRINFLKIKIIFF